MSRLVERFHREVRVRGHVIHPAGAVLAVLAALRHMVLMTSANNDNFLHMTLAQQLLAGDWPVRDFYDGGWLLQYASSAAAQLIVGDRLAAEAVVVGIAWAFSTYIVFRVVQQISGSSAAATLAGILLILASARGYSYPKGIVYAVMALLWWSYVRHPTTRKIAGLGAWAAVAFYFRPDHGVYIAVAIALAAWSAHGLGRMWVAACAVAGSVLVALLLPSFAYVHAIVGLGNYVQTGMAAARTEHMANGPHAWPVLRFAGNIVTIEPADLYGPVIGIRWSQSSSAEARDHLLADYGLTPVETDGNSLRVRLSAQALGRLRSLINEPSVEDTAGIERATATLLPAAWPEEKRRTFDQPWRRIRILPDLEAEARVTELIVALFYILPILMAAAASSMARRLPGAMSPRALVAFAGFAFLVDLAMLRLPFTARVFDAVVLSAIVFGCVIAWMWRAGSGFAGVAISRTSGIALAAILTASVARAGQLTNPLNWAAPVRELMASPPLHYYVGRPARMPVQLAAYVRACVPPSERLLVLWFEPEIFYYSERLMAQQHLVFAPAWADLAHEQDRTIQKIKRFSPPLALARSSALEGYARATYPGVVKYVESEYRLAATIDGQDEQYEIFARRDRPALRGFGSQNWPCFVLESSPWERVGTAD